MITSKDMFGQASCDPASIINAYCFTPARLQAPGTRLLAPQWQHPSFRAAPSRRLKGLLPRKAQQRDDQAPRPSILPAGKRQARVQLPALFLAVSSERITSTAATETLANVDAAVTGGATAIVLRESPSGGAAQLYEAAIALMEALRGRALLLIQDRTDIADASGADGVLLSSAGLPTVVAKGMVSGGVSLVGRAVKDGAAAVQAATEGAGFVILQGGGVSAGAFPTADIVAAARRQRSGASVPILVDLSLQIDSNVLDELIAAGADGALVELDNLSLLTSAVTQQAEADASLSQAAAGLLDRFSSSQSASQQAKDMDENMEEDGASSPPVAQVSQLLSVGREAVVTAEKEALGRLLSFLDTSCPGIEEISLLRDALAQLDELFLIVVVGEFNSGKSAVINALLGRRVLEEGILPTTNEISVLKWADPEDPTAERSEQTSDGLFVRYIPADLLREVNVVDTPGTNVILDRQQRLTEEFVPRADLVLFVMSADRPFTDSEVRFLRYIRQWGKKVVFVVNKVDLLTSSSEVQEVSAFVEDNARRLLGVDGARVIPVSARLAAEAKLACRALERDDTTAALTLREQQCLAEDAGWASSKFEGLESFIRDFLLGSEEGAGESVRLKLRTPLFVGEALLGAAQAQLEAEAEVARADAASAALVRSQLAAFRTEMVKEGRLLREEVGRELAAVARKSSEVIDATLQLSNWDSLSAYLFGPGARGGQLPVASRFQKDTPREATARMAALLQEHSSWVASNCQRQSDNYRGFAAARAAALGRSLQSLEDLEGAELEKDPEARRRWRQLREGVEDIVENNSETSIISVADSTSSILDPQATQAMLEEEVREAVLSTASTAAGAGAVGVILTTVLPTTLEDLLALALSAAIGYASVLNLPLRRAETKKKIEAATAKVTAEIQGKMEAELEGALGRCEAEVMLLLEPLETLLAEEVRRAEAALAARSELADELAELQRRAASVEQEGDWHPAKVD